MIGATAPTCHTYPNPIRPLCINLRSDHNSCAVRETEALPRSLTGYWYERLEARAGIEPAHKGLADLLRIP